MAPRAGAVPSSISATRPPPRCASSPLPRSRDGSSRADAIQH